MRKIKWIVLLLCTIFLLNGCGGAAHEETEPTNTQLYVLMYHSVAADGADCGPWTVTESTFRAHMNWLTEHGYTSVFPSQLVAGEPLPERAVLITFDDGYSDNCTRAVPVLQETGHKAVVSIVTSYMDVEWGFMTWEEVCQTADSGVMEIGSHTHNLHRYPGLQRQEGETQEEYEARAFPDLEESIRLIEEHTGKKPTLIAYPHGIVDEWVEEYTNQLFPVTLYGEGAVNDIRDGLQGLRRYNVNEQTDLSAYLPE